MRLDQKRAGRLEAGALALTEAGKTSLGQPRAERGSSPVEDAEGMDEEGTLG